MTLLLAISMLAGIQTGNASRYGYEGDIYDRVGSFACRRTLLARYGEKGWQRMRGTGLAHRTLPCGTRLGVCNVRTGQCTVAYVVDRGPWGVLDRKGEWHVRTGKLRPGEYYRGHLDLLPGTYTAINVVGIEKVAFWPMPEPDPVELRRGVRMPPLRAMGPAAVATYVTPSRKDVAFPALREEPVPASTVLTAPAPVSAPVMEPAPSIAAPASRSGVSFPPLRLNESPRSRHGGKSRFPPLRS